MKTIQSGSHFYRAWTDGLEIEQQAVQQFEDLVGLPFVHGAPAMLPDAHWGYGTTVGTVFATDRAIIPAAVGVDIGCGMMAVRTNLTSRHLPENLHALRTEIERRIPHGRTNDGRPGDRGAWHDAPDVAHQAYAGFQTDFARIADKYPKLEKPTQRAVHHLGTLGGGNHFVEICLDEEDLVWVMLHSGSRGVGNAIGNLFINRAKEEMERWFVSLPNKDLAYFPEGTTLFDDYVHAVSVAQNFAAVNRRLMMNAAMSALRTIVPTMIVSDQEAVNCHHNYVQKERHFSKDVWLTRKGAVSAREGELGIIPGSMGAKSFIVRGKGNYLSYNSCSHGAGRSMSRTEAKKRFTLEDHALATAGVECRKDAEVIDETPMAYKDIDAVMAAQADLVEIVHTLKQIVCVKG